MAWLRRTLLRLLAPVSRLIGKKSVGAPKNAGILLPVADILQVGDVIVTRTKWRPTNWLIPGFWSHSAMYVGDGVVEAVWPDVALTALEDFSGDWAAILRPKFAAQPFCDAAAVQMRLFVGTPYDVMFEPGHKAMYCSEAVYAAYKMAVRELTFEPRLRMGVMTVIPQDFADAQKYFETVWTNRD